MKILIACECSGIVRDAFRNKGHNAISCDLKPTEQPGPHIQTNVCDILHLNWDAIIAFPPCTHLTQAQPKKLLEQKIADGRAPASLEFIKTIYNACHIVCIENPLSWYLNTWMPYTQIVQPYYFGHNYSKRTCLWLKNLPPLISTCHITTRAPMVKTWGACKNQTLRSRFHTGIAQAMAEQWLTT